MSVEELLSDARARGIELWTEGGRLHYSAPPGALTPELAARLSGRKPEIIGFLGDARRATRVGPAPAPQGPAAARSGGTPLSFAQERLWFLDHLEGGNGSVYNMAFAVELSGPLDAPALERALVEIVARHEALRTTFAIRDGKPVQVVSPDPTLRLVVVELGSAPPEAQTDEVRRRSGEAAREPFDLAAGPLIRATLLRLGGGSHVLLLTVHHIVFDGWSMGIFQRELRALYEAFSGGGGAQVPPPALQYADFALWQREWLRGTVLEEQLGYWRRRLEGAPRLLELPGDRPRPAVQSYRGALHRTELGVELTGRLHELGREAGCTLFMTLLAGFSALLGRYTGERDVVVASPIANRNRVELEEIIGFFVNTLVLRMDLEGDPPFGGLLARARETATGAYDHQDLPFERLVEELRPERNLSHNPLAQVSLVLQNAPEGEFELAGLRAGLLETHTATTKFDLTLFVVDGVAGLECTWEYATDLFDGTTVARMAAHFRNLLEGAVAGPERPVWELPVLSAAERRQIVVEWNDTGVAYPPACLHHLFERQVARTPAAVAVVFGDEHLTYGELDARANRLAHHLRRAGVGPEARVAIHVERSLEMVVGVLGVLKAGGAYVPLDPEYPPERLSFMMADSGASVLLTQDRLASGAPTSGACVVRLDADWPRIADGDATAPPCGATPANLAYVIYTSGSSGTPKGVMISHDAICNQILWVLGEFGLDASDNVLLKAPFSFDPSVKEIFVPLLAGARLTVAEPGAQRDASSLAATIFGQQVTTLLVVPSLLQTLVDHPAFGRCSSLRRIWCAGEALSPALRDRCLAVVSAELCNLYGPTEASVDVSLWRCERGGGSPLRVPIGRPVANTELYVLDPSLRPQPVGVPGELYIGGAQVARGYLGRVGLTAERFVPDPFSPRPGSRLYRTGDRVRLGADGNVEYLDRVDNQIKMRGCRIEPGEVEAVIRRHRAVRACAVVAVREPSGDTQLAAYLVADPGDSEFSTRTQQSERETVDRWRAMYDDLYAAAPPTPDPVFNTVGWTSSYTGLPLSDEEMREWVEGTVESIQRLRPERVLEIGAGTGLLAGRLAPGTRRYVATDFSLSAVRGLERLREARPGLEHLQVQHRAADDFAGLEPRAFDLVILNSVVQYFPSADYLEGVLRGALALVQPSGAVFVGDVRSLPLLGAFHLSLLLPGLPPETPVAEVRRRLLQKSLDEKELVLHPDFFHSLRGRCDGVGGVRVELKRGRHHNEMMKYRYDVVIRAGAGDGHDHSIQVLDWDGSRLTPALLRHHLVQGGRSEVVVRGIPNARVHADVERLRRVQAAESAAPVGRVLEAASRVETLADPADLLACGGPALEGHATWSRSDPPGSIDVWYSEPTPGGGTRAHEAAPLPGGAAPAYANAPLRARMAQWLVPEVRALTRGALPEFMVPSSFALVDEIPLTPNGKVDRGALPSLPSRSSLTKAAFEAPRDEAEAVIARVWRDVLGLDQVGVHENFFDVGGHSLRLVEVRTRLNLAFGREFTIVELFQHPTVRSMADLVSAGAGTDDPLAGLGERRRRATQREGLRITRSLSRDRDPGTNLP